MMKYIIGLLIAAFSLTSCIENDIPFPKVDLQVLAVEVEGQSNADDSRWEEAVISKKERMVKLYVNDKVDVSRLRIKRFETTEGAKVTVDGYPSFPENGFTSEGNLPVETDSVVMDFTHPVTFRLSKYQDYVWTVTVHQVVKRDIIISGQVGQPVIDLHKRMVVIYVNKDQSLEQIKVDKMRLGGQSGKVEPDPRSITDFSYPVDFEVKQGWSDNWQSWTVYVYNKILDEPTTTSVFPKTTSAVVSGGLQGGKAPLVRYRESGDSEWTTSNDVVLKNHTFENTISNLSPDTSYEYQVVISGDESKVASFVTAPATPLENGDFEAWHLEKDKIWNPWDAQKDSFWDTGNDGAAIVGKSNSVPTSDDTFTGKGKAAKLETRNMMGFLAAGNIFTGTYVRTEIPNGILSFGRPFHAFPTKLRVHYKYKSTTISHVKEPFTNLRGEADMFHIYIALTHWDKPLEIRTDPKKRQLFNKNDPQVIAYAEISQNITNTEWKTQELVLEYRKQEVPTHLLIVATASKYGDYFTGGEGSQLLVDDFELIYE